MVGVWVIAYTSFLQTYLRCVSNSRRGENYDQASCLIALLLALLYVTVAAAQHPVLDAVANKVVAKYQSSTCMPYGPTYDPTQPYDGIERGLLGYFINSSIENQYEFVLAHWVNDSEFAGAVRLNPKSKDPMIGTQDPAESIFVIPQANDAPPIKIPGFSTFITTKAAAYCFLPSITAIKFIANLA